ncbi:hypothetical protein OG884_04195 [Streptosporangium sp. NBC_01755]|uniref:hypothetical protein n=1 Tax=unclassified Streptosporangium TaxID=2632669 RepID=UPI002DDBB552|nr:MULTISPECIES: hypothetical protein [unclassified Streptosporangium]WSA27301.1 hypothetical protein OIE13_05340 [Streptosporangium sp. NBC_01810]WSD01147.1 hypothetical protein OG884_04195 [Streptosporangium sp. NBC_01755]
MPEPVIFGVYHLGKLGWNARKWAKELVLKPFTYENSTGKDLYCAMHLYSTDSSMGWLHVPSGGRKVVQIPVPRLGRASVIVYARTSGGKREYGGRGLLATSFHVALPTGGGKIRESHKFAIDNAGADFASLRMNAGGAERLVRVDGREFYFTGPPTYRYPQDVEAAPSRYEMGY